MMRVEHAHAVGTTQRDISLSTDPLDLALQSAPVFALFREAPVVDYRALRRRRSSRNMPNLISQPSICFEPEPLPKLLTLKILKQKDIKVEWRVRFSVMRVRPAIRVGKSSASTVSRQ